MARDETGQTSLVQRFVKHHSQSDQTGWRAVIAALFSFFNQGSPGRIIGLGAVLMALGLVLPASAQVQEPGQTQTMKVEANLLAPVSAIRPGEPFTVGLHQKIEPNWHTYWKNPGDSGQKTEIAWDLPQGWSASDIAWPVPEALPIPPLMNYGYSNEVMLPVTLTPPADLPRGRVTLNAHATWLVCEKICIPEEKSVALTLDVVGPDDAIKSTKHADLFAAAERARPIPSPWPAKMAVADESIRLHFAVQGVDPARIRNVEFFPEEWGYIKPAAPQPASWSPDGVTVELTRGELAGQSLHQLNGVLVLTEAVDGTTIRNGFHLLATPGEVPLPSPVPATDLGTAGIGLWQAILFAMLGGLVLNLMPCVLPILSVKALSLASHGGRTPALAFLGGVQISFLVLAAALLVLRSAGETVGWGFQFQSPAFVLALAAFFFAMALSLSGVFHVGSGVIGLGEGLTRQSGARGAFFTGVLATIAATPCTAPFMGAALGYAVTQPPLETVLVLQALGLGFALPLVLLALSDTMRRVLPKPGPWMDTLKQALAFPLYATVGWLVWVLSLQTGSEGVLAAAVVLVGVGVAAWLAGRHQWGIATRSGIAAVVILGALYFVAPRLAVETGPAATTVALNTVASADEPAAEPYSAARLDQLRADGKAVFVNFTAAWCITCKVNEQIVLKSDSFQQALDRSNAVYMVGDWTRRDDEITRVLHAHGRAGVPLYLLYPADKSQPAQVLPQLLTEAIVIDRLASVSRPERADLSLKQPTTEEIDR